jgi:hypothetical protein
VGEKGSEGKREEKDAGQVKSIKPSARTISRKSKAMAKNECSFSLSLHPLTAAQDGSGRHRAHVS